MKEFLLFSWLIIAVQVFRPQQMTYRLVSNDILDFLDVIFVFLELRAHSLAVETELLHLQLIRCQL